MLSSLWGAELSSLQVPWVPESEGVSTTAVSYDPLQAGSCYEAFLSATQIFHQPASLVVFTLQLDDVSTFDGDAVWSILQTVSQSHVFAWRQLHQNLILRVRWVEGVPTSRPLFQTLADVY